MIDSPQGALRIGSWRVDPATDQICHDGGDPVRVEVQTMRVLLYLAARPGQVVSIDELLEQVWTGVIVTSDSVYQAITSLRRVLGDDAKQPEYIATVPRRGYRMVAPVSQWTDAPGREAVVASLPATRSWWTRRTAQSGVAVALVVAFGLIAQHTIGNRAAVAPQHSIAVLAFLDLTDDRMSHETFADGMTEELIDRFTKIPSLRVAAPTSSFFFKNKKVTVADIAKTLGVTYVLDGSIRQSGELVRVAARLVRADSGYVVWSETYDRPFKDVLAIQDDIATEVTTALRTSIGARQPEPVSRRQP